VVCVATHRVSGQHRRRPARADCRTNTWGLKQFTLTLLATGILCQLQYCEAKLFLNHIAYADGEVKLSEKSPRDQSFAKIQSANQSPEPKEYLMKHERDVPTQRACFEYNVRAVAGPGKNPGSSVAIMVRKKRIAIYGDAEVVQVH
jgi:hypothetical protein